MSFQLPSTSPKDLDELVSAVVAATINSKQPTLNQLLQQVIYVIPSQEQEASLKAKVAKDLLIQIVRKLEESLGSPTAPTIAWFVVYVGLGSSPPEALQSVQMLLDKDFKPFEDFFVDRQGIHFYNQGATQEKINQLPERLSEFTQMTVHINMVEVKQVIERFDISEPEARKVLLNLKILEKKTKLPVEHLLSLLTHNQALLQEIVQADLTASSSNRFDI